MTIGKYDLKQWGARYGLPESLPPPPEIEAVELALEAIIFDAHSQDAEALAKAQDDTTLPLKAYLLLDASIDPDVAIFAETFAEENTPGRCSGDQGLLIGQAHLVRGQNPHLAPDLGDRKGVVEDTAQLDQEFA